MILHLTTVIFLDGLCVYTFFTETLVNCLLVHLLTQIVMKTRMRAEKNMICFSIKTKLLQILDGFIFMKFPQSGLGHIPLLLQKEIRIV